MAVTKTLIGAVPSNKDGEVQEWNFLMKYEEGDKTWDEETEKWIYAANYYTHSFSLSLLATDPDGTVNFTPKAEASWTLAELTALCPTDKWDNTFDRMYDTVITNPPDLPVADTSYVIPS